MSTSLAPAPALFLAIAALSLASPGPFPPSALAGDCRQESREFGLPAEGLVGAWSEISQAEAAQQRALSPEERRLAGLINDYRVQNGLKPLPISGALTAVARAHVHDLHENPPARKSGCNAHSWSDRGPWIGCCYRDPNGSPRLTAAQIEAQSRCMWDKGREIGGYDGNSIEILAEARGMLGDITPEQALSSWKGPQGVQHREAILNRGGFAQVRYAAMGVALYKNHAVVWFGDGTSPEVIALGR
jgi:uncharacterized protein YkwD